MIVPSIDIMDGRAVQLVEGKEKVLDAGDPRPLAKHFGRIGEVAVIDLDAALGCGNNTGVIRELLELAPCCVGGGIRDVQAALEWLDAGAHKVILGTAAKPEILRHLPCDRMIAALDTRGDRVVVEGWTKVTNANVLQCIDELRGYVSGFLVTFVEHEGRMGGLPHDRVQELVERCKGARLTVAGGVRNPEDVAAADRVGADVQVGMALYTDSFDLADGFCAPLKSDRSDGLWPTIVTDPTGNVLGLVYSSRQSIRESLECGYGTYYSRSRNRLWRKGESSGNAQELLRIGVDCDRDALQFTVRQHGEGFCHTGQSSCFGSTRGIAQLQRTIIQRALNAHPDSYTRRLLNDKQLLKSKLLEEATELAEANSRDDVAWESADLLYFTLVTATRAGVSLEHIERELDQRSLQVSRRSGDANEGVR